MVLLLVVGYAAFYQFFVRKDRKLSSSGSNTPQIEFIFDPNSAGLSSPDQPKTNPPVQTLPKNSSSYTQAVNDYQYRIQFTECHGVVNTPNVGILSVAKGTKFMLDNRDAKAHTFAFKDFKVRIAGYGYAIVTPTVLGIYPITCDGGGAVTLHVQ